MPQILSPSYYGDLLSDAIRDRSDLDEIVEKAEYYVVDRYRAHSRTTYGLRFAGHPFPVMLDGWAETDNGNPDTGAMPQDLVRRLRIVIADVVAWRIKLEQQEGMESISQGSESVSFSELDQLPSRLFRPLDKYDDSEPFSGYW